MRKIAFYGASDDLVEVEGEIPGCDEYPATEASFTVAGLMVKVSLGEDGCWGIKVIQINEDVPVLAQDLALSVPDRRDGDQGYSMRLDMLVPDGSYITRMKTEFE